MIVEIPAFLGVLVTGVILLFEVAITAALVLKLICGIAAILANLYCVRLVFLRVGYAKENQWSAFERADDQ